MEKRGIKGEETRRHEERGRNGSREVEKSKNGEKLRTDGAKRTMKDRRESSEGSKGGVSEKREGLREYVGGREG